MHNEKTAGTENEQTYFKQVTNPDRGKMYLTDDFKIVQYLAVTVVTEIENHE